jgi:hypothetical protein
MKIEKVDHNELSFKKFLNLNVKIGFRERIKVTKNLELRKGSRGRELRKQSVIELSFKKFFQFKHEVKFSGKNQGHQRSRALEGIKSMKTKKTKCD